MEDKIFALKLSKRSFLYDYFMYVDAVCSDGELVSQKVFNQYNFDKCKIIKYLESATEKYVISFCRIRKHREEKFEECLQYFPTAMSLQGFFDYEDYVENLMKQIIIQNILFSLEK